MVGLPFILGRRPWQTPNQLPIVHAHYSIRQFVSKIVGFSWWLKPPVFCLNQYKPKQQCRHAPRNKRHSRLSPHRRFTPSIALVSTYPQKTCSSAIAILTVRTINSPMFWRYVLVRVSLGPPTVIHLPMTPSPTAATGIVPPIIAPASASLAQRRGVCSPNERVVCQDTWLPRAAVQAYNRREYILR